MKNLKAILLVAVVAVSTLGFNSCKKDSDDTHPVVGTWEFRQNVGANSAIITYVVKETGTYHFSIADPANILGLGLGAYYTEMGVCEFSNPSLMFYGGGSTSRSAGTALVSYPAFTLSGNLSAAVGAPLIFHKK